ncbi:MAG: dialkylresorcinol condensing enzyme DarA [Flavobacteriales bacterium]|nr:dialkylresorcinol condensing enzyme DarA [Flavobacteriales bacterium]
MKKHILVLTYSQTGQTDDIAGQIIKPFLDSDNFEIHYEKLKPKVPYPFPWSGLEFFDAFPETVQEVPMELQADTIPEHVKWDLILVGYQPWFLSVCRPVNSFLQSEKAKQIFNGTPVVTFLGCRNMFVNAQEKMKRRLHGLNARLVGQIALVDKSANLVSLVTILAWMLKGVREGFLGIFPRSGVSEQETMGAEKFGRIIRNRLELGNYEGMQDELLAEGAMEIKPSLLIMESRGAKNFRFWARFVSAKGGSGNPARFGRLRLFMVILPSAIVILTPITTILKWIVSMVKRKHLLAEAEYYKSIRFRGYDL